MSLKKSELSRRAFMQATSLGVGSLALLPKSQAATPAVCRVGFHYQTYTVQDVKVLTQASPGTMGAVAPEHAISISYFKAVAFKVGSTNGQTETRHLLCVDVGMAGAAGVYHPMEANGVDARNTITDIYVFDQADNSLLFWRKLSGNDVAPWAMFIVPEAVQMRAPKITVVARCSAHGYWGQDFDMSVTPTPYATPGVVGSHDFSKLYGGATVMRPYTSAVDPAINKEATGVTQSGLGEYHRPNIIKVSDNRVEAFLGGSLSMAGSHDRFEDKHYIAGGLLFDQNGNQLGKTEVILFSEAPQKKVVFTGFSLAAEGVKTLRVIMNDTYQGRFMGFLDI